MLIKRIYEIFTLPCLLCGGEIRLIALINDAAGIRKILVHLGEPHEPPKISPAREPPLWDACDEARKDQFDVEVGEVFESDLMWDERHQRIRTLNFRRRNSVN
jgi:hypothetical protein